MPHRSRWRAPLRSLRSKGSCRGGGGPASGLPFMLIGSHVPCDDALSHRFGMGEFVAVYIGLVLLRIGFRER